MSLENLGVDRMTGLEQRLADYVKRLRAEVEHEAKRYQPSGARLVVLHRVLKDLDNLTDDSGDVAGLDIPAKVDDRGTA